MGNKSIKRNVILNGIQQIVTLLLPFITVPYLTRVIGKDGIGTYSYTSSIIQYFILFGTIGLSLYGTREIAYVRNNKKQCDQAFWQIQFLRMSCCTLALLVYVAILVLFQPDYKVCMYIQIFALLANMIDISWYYQGIEEFDKIVFRSVLCRIIGTVCIFVFVRSSNDTWIYVLIQVLILFLGNVALWIPASKSIESPNIDYKKVLIIIRPAIALFIPQVAIELYAVFDKTMLGFLSTVGDVGLYAKAEEFSKIPLMLISVIAAVLFPRMSNIFAEKGEAALDVGLNNNIKLISFIGVGASFGIFGIAENFVPWMMGAEFHGSIELMKLMAPLSFIIGLSNMIGRQYLLPSNQSRIFTITVTFGAATNFILNILLIQRIGAVGACIATLIAEGIVTISQLLYVRKHIEVKSYLFDLLKCVIAGIVMLVAVYFTGEFVSVQIFNTISQIIIGILVYFIMLTLFKNPYAALFRKEAIGALKRMIRHV